MTYRAHETSTAITLEPAGAATASVIWLHGLGADGYDFVPIVEGLRLPPTLAVRFVFPHASERPVTINNGFVMRAWYDIKSLSMEGREDEQGIRESGQVVRDYIEAQIALGVPSQRIVVAGFSQGGAVALHTALRYSHPLAGILGLSTYLPLRDSLAQELHPTNRATPIFLAHGTQDSVVPMMLGVLSRDVLTQLGLTVEWRTYPVDHGLCADEVSDISRWLQTRLH